MSLYEVNQEIKQKSQKTGKVRTVRQTDYVDYSPLRGGEAKVVSTTRRVIKKPDEEWVDIT